jgi:hypothetical protein
MAAIHISKTNLAVASHAPATVYMSKTNLAVASRPLTAWAAISKTNITIASRDGVVEPPPARRRALFVS